MRIRITLILALLGVLASRAEARPPQLAASAHTSRLAASSPYDALWTDEFALPDVAGNLTALVHSDSDIIAGGGAYYWGTTYAEHVARWDGALWHPMGSGIPSTVTSMIHYGALIVAGTFGSPSAQPTVYTWDGASWSAIGASNGTINALATIGSDLYVGGNFNTINGVAATNVARWDGAAWHAVGSGLSGSVRALIVHGGQLIAAGSLAGQNGIAAWNGVSWAQVGAGFKNGSGAANVISLATNGTTLFAAGTFTTSGGIPITGVASWNGSTWGSLAGAPSTSNPITVYGGSVVAAFPVAGVTKPRQWNGSAWTDFGAPVFTPTCYAVDGPLLHAWGAGGGIASSRPTLNPIRAFDGTTWSDVQQAWTSGMQGIAGGTYSALTSHDSLFVGGTFGYVGSQNQFLLVSARAQWDGSQWHSLGLIGGQIFCMDIWNDQIVLAADGKIQTWSGTSWTTLGPPNPFWPLWPINYLGTLLEYGDVGVSATGAVARWDGSAWQDFGDQIDDPSGIVLWATTWGTRLVLGGAFNSRAGAPVRNLILWDGATWHDVGGGVNADVEALTPFEGDLIVGGLFTEVGGDSIRGVARWNGSQWSAMGTNAVNVFAFKVHGGRLYAAGTFLDQSNAPIVGAAVWTGTRWLPLGSGVDPRGAVYSIEFLNEDLYAVGDFGFMGGHAARNIARLPNASVLAVEPPHAGATLALAPAPNPSRGLVRLSFTLPADGRARVTIHDLAGREVARLADGAFAAGAHTLSWSGRVAPGLYFARLEAGGATRTARIVRVQ